MTDGGGDEAAPARRMQSVFAHQVPDLLMVHDPALMPERRLHLAPAISLELVLDRVHGLDQGGGAVSSADPFGSS